MSTLVPEGYDTLLYKVLAVIPVAIMVADKWISLSGKTSPTPAALLGTLSLAGLRAVEVRLSC